MQPDVLAKRIESAGYEREQALAYCDYIVDASQPLENVVEAFVDILDSVV